MAAITYNDKTSKGIVCTKSLDPIYIITYYRKWVKTSWTYSKLRAINNLLHGFLVLLAVGAPAVLVQHVNRHLRQVEPRPR